MSDDSRSRIIAERCLRGIRNQIISLFVFSALLMTSPAAFPISQISQNREATNSDIYSETSLDHREKQLQRIAQQLSRYTLTRLQAGNTTLTTWIVKDEKNEKLAVLKCTFGNNYAEGEIATYYLGRLLNFPLYPVTVATQISGGLARQLGIPPRTCALKEWLQNWSVLYWKAQVNLQKIIKQGNYQKYKSKNTFLSANGDAKSIVDTVMCRNNLNQVKEVSIKLTSRIRTKRNGDPLIGGKQGTFFTSTPTPLLKVARDFSNMMLLDAVIGNDDRFPGANLEFRSATNQSRQIGDTEVMILQPRLSSIDTGASFKGWNPSWGQLEMGYYLRRFDPEMIERLRELLNQLERLKPDNLKGKWAFLKFKTQRYPNLTAVEYLKANIRRVLKFVDQVKNKQQQEVIPDRKNFQCSQVFLPLE